MKTNNYFIHYNDTLYHLRCDTLKPQKAELLLCAFSTRFGDEKRTAVLFEKGKEYVACYTPKMPYESHSQIFTLHSIKSHGNPIDKMAFCLLDMLPDEINRLQEVWILELYNGHVVIIPEAKI